MRHVHGGHGGRGLDSVVSDAVCCSGKHGAFHLCNLQLSGLAALVL
jgi:hypothetical protein